MDCPKCQRRNPADARFCARCGTRLSSGCESCGTWLPPEARFCPGCGRAIETGSTVADTSPRPYTPRHLAEKVLAHRSTLEGERKQVTVLFADVKGSMELAAQVDPEEWHRILDRFFQILADGVHRYEGTVNQYTGDGIMALFGAPVAHEDHAQRACQAALALREELRRYATELRRTRGLNFSVRMGLSSGQVVVGKIGDDLRMDYTAQGHTVGLAARVEELAEAGAVYLTEATASLIEGFFELEDLGPFDIRGVRAPVRVYALRGPGPLRSRFDVSRSRGLTPLVGRERELEQLEGWLAEALEGRGRAVAVLGDAGIGKTRLCHEFAERCRSRGFRVLYGQAPSHGRRIPFLPILEFLRGAFGIRPQDAPREAREKIAGALVLLGSRLEEHLPVLFDFLGVPDPERPPPALETAARHRQLFALVRELIHRRGLAEPTVIWVEDLHWLDPGSTPFVDHMVEAVVGTRALLVATSRREFRAGWLDEAQSRRLDLAPLAPEHCRQLVEVLLGDDPSVASVADRVSQHAAGNPFFAEEIVHSLLAEGVLEGSRGACRRVGALEGVAIPPRVESLLAARIDRLPDRAKAALQAASVLGGVFARGLLERVADLPAAEAEEAMDLLERAELVRLVTAEPEATYAFAHPLTHHVAYGSQLAAVRRRRHAEAARVLSESEAGTPGEQAALIAHHWECAGDKLRAAQAGARVARWLSLSDAGESFRRWGEVGALLRDVPESPESLRLSLRSCAGMLNFGWRQGLSPEQAGQLFARGVELARRVGDLRREALLHTSYGRMLGTVDNASAYLEHTREAARIAREIGEEAVQLVADMLTAQGLRWAGQLDEVLVLLDEILGRDEAEITRAARYLALSPHLWALAQRGMCLLDVGRLAEAEACLERVVQAASAWHQPDLLVAAQRTYVDLHRIRGDVAAAMAQAAELVEYAERMDNAYARVDANWGLGEAFLLRGSAREAVEALERALAMANQHVVELEYEGTMLALLAEAQLLAGDPVRGRATAERAVRAARRRHMRVSECEASLSLARVLLRAGPRVELDRAEDVLRGTLSLVERTNARGLEPFVRLELAELAWLRGDAPAQREELATARALFEKIGAPRRAAAVGERSI